MPGSIWRDIRFAARQLSQSRLYAIVAVLSLAVGIGATTTIFSVVNALLVRPRPGIAEQGLVDVGRSQDGSGFDNLSYPNFRDYREASRQVFVDLAAQCLEPQPLSLADGDTVVRIYGQTVSGNYFDVLGARPQLGRFFTPAEDEAAGRDLVAVASDRFWREHLAASPGAIGRTLVLNGRTFTLVGVAPSGFTGTTVLGPDVWTPIHALTRRGQLERRASVWLIGIGRLRPEVPLEQAQAALNTVAADLLRVYPTENRGQGVKLLPSSAFPGEMHAMVSGFLTLLLAFVGLILLVACVNLAGLTLARGTLRRREIAIRLAIGAPRRRLVTQLLTESLVLFVLGGIAGLVLALWLRNLLVALVPHLPVPVAIDLPLDLRVLGFALAVTLACGLLTGLAPALQFSRATLISTLRDAGGGVGQRPSLRARNTLVTIQIALSMLLVVAAGLLARSLQHASRIDAGFDPANVEVASLDLTLGGLDETSGRLFVDDLLARVNAMPSVTAASVAVDLPLDGGGFGLGDVRPSDRDGVLGHGGPGLDWNIVTPAFHETMRIRLVAGRPFDARDRSSGRPVAIVNETLARRLWPGENPLGKRLLNEGPSGEVALEVIGVERDLKYRSLGEAPRPFIYVPLAQRWFSRLTLVVRHEGARSVVPEVRAIVRQLNPYLPIVDAQSLSSYVSIGLMPQRVGLAIAGSLGLVGLFLAGIGISGVMAYSVARRTREVGVRMALGASRRDVMVLVFRQSAATVTAGILLGCGLALAGGRALAGLLYGIGPTDPPAYVLAIGLFMAAALAASYAPARRAISVDPVTALRQE
jgi:predicted permease